MVDVVNTNDPAFISLSARRDRQWLKLGMPTAETPLARVLQAELLQKARMKISECLTQQEARILMARVGSLDEPGETLEQIGKRENLTREQVRLIENKARRKVLRHMARSSSRPPRPLQLARADENEHLKLMPRDLRLENPKRKLSESQALQDYAPTMIEAFAKRQIFTENDLVEVIMTRLNRHIGF